MVKFTWQHNLPVGCYGTFKMPPGRLDFWCSKGKKWPPPPPCSSRTKSHRREPSWLFKIGTLSKDVFERRTSTGSEAFSLLICLDANKLVLLSFCSLLKTIYQRVSTKPLPNDAKSPLPVDVRRSKTLLLKLPNISSHPTSVPSFSQIGWPQLLAPGTLSQTMTLLKCSEIDHPHHFWTESLGAQPE